MASSFLNNYFGFNKQQRNGLLVLSIISFLLLLTRLIYPSFIVPESIIISNLPLVERKLDSSFAVSQKHYPSNFLNTEAASNLFVFDPNTVSFSQLIQLGFKDKTANTFLTFRNKGFVFKQKTDLKKVYGISDNFYSKLEPYILIETNSEQNVQDKKQPITSANLDKPQTTKKVELNTVDSLALISLNGIGPSFAKRILKYRNMLGGFISIEQLKEVYGFTEELYDKVKSNVNVDAALIKKINLNTDDFKVINKHPYLSYELTKIIFDWRKKTVITASNLKDILNDNSVYNKLLPYINFD
jgi:competence protein ComEA